MKRKFIALTLALISFCGIASAVEIIDNGVYRIDQVYYKDNSMTVTGSKGITYAASNSDDEKQLWVAIPNSNHTGYYLRNYATGYYMTSPIVKNQQWTVCTPENLNDTNAVFTFSSRESTGDVLIFPLSIIGTANEGTQNGYAHAASSKVICYGNGAAASGWKLTHVAKTPEEISAKMATWANYVAEITPGRAYRLINDYYGHAMVPGNNNSLVGREADKSDINQVWIVESNTDGEGYFLRHYESGKVATSSCAREKAWSVQDIYVPDQTVSAMYFNKKASGFGISTLSTRDDNNESTNYTYAHENNVSTILGYVVNSNPSLWHFSPVEEITESDIAAKTHTWECYKKNSIDVALAAIFTDPVCTELTPKYASMDPAKLDSDPNVLALPEGLRPMVKKIRTGDWSETDPFNGNKWDSTHAKKLRVQMVEPVSHCGGTASLAGIQAYTDFNNPTGIVTDNGTVLYVMVDKDPAPGATLNIAGRTGEGTPLVTLNNISDGFPLRKGLNIVPCNKDLADMIVYYTVRTANGRNRQYCVTDFDDIKIHIEGGSLNGYFNAVGDSLYTPDTTEDWLYYRERARHAMFTLISKYTLLYIHFHDIFDEKGNKTQCLKSICTPEAYAEKRYDLNATMKAWDEMYVAETMVMGLLSKDVIEAEKAAGRDYYDTLDGDRVARDDYYKYFNNRHLGLTLRECGFMNATWYRTAYNPSTIASIIRDFPTGDFWGPAHEFGHLNQGPMCIAGTTEESNNIFSNVYLLYRGKNTSRADFPSEQRRRFNASQNFHQHDTWGTTRMWLQLWLYYHYMGNDKRFYPRLYELLRNNPLRRTKAPGKEGDVNPMYAKDDLLHFAKMACVAAGEDLTDFFEAWGFFVEQDGYYIGDYTSYTSYLSAEDIANWKAEIANMAAENNWKKNHAIMFIDDRVGSDKVSYGFDKNKCGSMGGLKDYKELIPVTGNYTFTITGNSVNITGGKGGVGFMIHDKNGKLIGFANDPVFEVNDSTAAKLRAGEAIVQVVAPDNQLTTVVDAIHDGSLEQRLEAIDILLGNSETVLAKSDRNNLKPGFLKPEVVAGLQTIYDTVKAMRDSSLITESNCVNLYDSLYAQYMAIRSVQATVDNTIPIQPGGIYVFISNILYPGKGITANAAGTLLANVTAGNVNMDDTAQQWIFEPTDEEGYYYIRNVKFNKYIGKAPADKGIVTLVNEPMKQLVVFRELGAFSVSPEGSDHDSLHDDGNGRLTRWDSSAKASRWTLSLIDNWEYQAAMTNLLAIIEKSEKILAQAGTITENQQGDIVATPNEQYQFVTADMLVNLYNLLQNGKQLSQQPNAPIASINEVCNQMTEAYNTLLAAMNRNIDRLVELIDKVRTLANTVGVINEQILPITLSGDNMYSNAPHTGAGSDKFTTWNVLFDKNYNTFFHSNYQNVNSADGLDHYIRIALPEQTQDSASFIFSYVTRKNNDSNWFPVEATLEYSTDSVEWHTIADLNKELPIGSALTFESAPFKVPGGCQYLRFMVHKNRRSATSSATSSAGGHQFFVLSELSLSNYALSCTPLTDKYPSATSEAITGAITQAHIAEQVLNRPDYGHAQYDEAYEALMPHYNLLEFIAKNASGVTGITIDINTDLSNAVIYNLSGVRIKGITLPGFYIINGKKTLVR